MLLTLTALFFNTSHSAKAQTPAPQINHSPIKVAPRGKPINIIATIDGKGKSISSVTLYFRQTKDASPVSVAMESATVGSWYGTIPSSFVTGKGIIQYYIEAANAQGEWSETRYFTVNVTDPTGGPPPPFTENLQGQGNGPETPSSDRSWVRPAVLIGGGALVVAGAIALSDSGSSGGGSNNGDGNNNGGGNDNGGGGTDPGTPISDRVITRTISDRVNSVGTFPNEQIIDVSAEVANRTVESVRIDLTLDPLDGFEEIIEVLYENSTVIDTGVVFVPRTFTVTAAGNDPVIAVRVNTSRADEQGVNNYSWSATATFFLAN